MNKYVYSLLGLLVLVGLVITVVLYTRKQKETFVDLSCSACKNKGGRCSTDKDGKFVCDSKHGYTAMTYDDAQYSLHGIPNFPF